LTMHSSGNCVNIIPAKEIAAIPLTLRSGLIYNFSKIGSNESTVYLNLFSGSTHEISSDTSINIPVERSDVEGIVVSGNKSLVTDYIQKKIASFPQAAYVQSPKPNPFNPITSINYGIPFNFNGNSTFAIYNMRGQVIYTTSLAHVPGHHTVSWNTSDRSGRMVSAGVYIGRILIANRSFNLKMVVVK